MAVALVTGCSSGNGLATAVALARGGYKVAATMRRPERGGEIRTIAENESLPMAFIAMDVNDDQSVQDGFSKAEAELGPIDILVNNAGVPGGVAVEETSIETFRAVMETNFFGALRCIKAVVPAMRERQSGIIVNITSISGRIASASQASYAASKWAFEALCESLAQEMRPFGVRVAIVEPGVIATSIFAKAQLTERRYPYRRRMRALIEAALEKPTPPMVVGEAIVEIVKSGAWRLRHTVGPDAESWLKARRVKTDEQWVEQGGESDDEFVARVKRELGWDVVL